MSTDLFSVDPVFQARSLDVAVVVCALFACCFYTGMRIATMQTTPEQIYTCHPPPPPSRLSLPAPALQLPARIAADYRRRKRETHGGVSSTLRSLLANRLQCLKIRNAVRKSISLSYWFWIVSMPTSTPLLVMNRPNNRLSLPPLHINHTNRSLLRLTRLFACYAHTFFDPPPHPNTHRLPQLAHRLIFPLSSIVSVVVLLPLSISCLKHS